MIIQPLGNPYNPNAPKPTGATGITSSRVIKPLAAPIRTAQPTPISTQPAAPTVPQQNIFQKIGDTIFKFIFPSPKPISPLPETPQAPSFQTTPTEGFKTATPKFMESVQKPQAKTILPEGVKEAELKAPSPTNFWTEVKNKALSVIMPTNVEKDKAAVALQSSLAKKLGVKRTDIPLDYVVKNKDAITAELGVRNMPTTMEVVSSVMGLGILGGLALNPVGTIAGLAGFGATGEVLNFGVSKLKREDYTPLAGKGLSDLLPAGTNESIVAATDLLQFALQSKMFKSIYSKAPTVAEKLTKDMAVKYNLPETITLDKNIVREFYINGEKNITPEQYKAMLDLNLPKGQLRDAAKNGVSIQLPWSKVTTLTDKPYWKKIKAMFNIGSEPTVITERKGEVTKGVAGLLKAGENTPDEIINTVIVNNKETTPEGKEIIKIALQAQKQGQNIMVGEGEKPTIEAIIPQTEKAKDYLTSSDFANEVYSAKPENQIGIMDANKIVVRDPVDKNSQQYINLKADVEKNGFQEPVRIDAEKEPITVEGSHRVTIAQELGIKVPVIVNKGKIEGFQTIQEIYDQNKEVKAVEEKPKEEVKAPEEKPKEEVTIAPSKARTSEEVLAEAIRAGLGPQVIKQTFNRYGSGRHPDMYERPSIGKTEFKTLLANMDEFKENPVLTVNEDKQLVFKGKKSEITFETEGLQINPERLKVGDKIRVDLKGLKEAPGNIQQMRVFRGGNVEADFGGYANREVEDFLDNFPKVEMPELLNITKDLLGSTPSLNLFKTALGKFSHNDLTGEGKVKLDQRIFTDPKLAVRVLAHELGHAIDWFPDKSLSRGNILGHLASLRGYMDKYLAEYEGAEGQPLNEADIKRLNEEAKKLAEKGIEITTEEIIGSEPIKPDEVLAIWNTNSSSIEDPKLLRYIQGLTDYQKKSIVIQAMKGSVPKWVDFKRTLTKPITRTVIQNAPEDIKRIFQDLLKQEVEKRKLYENKEVRKELKKLTKIWKPFNEAQDPEYTSYRFSSKELYADAMSVLFNDPALLNTEAPTFFKGFLNYLDKKPETKKLLTETWDMINAGEESVFKKRDKEINEMYKTGEETILAKELERRNRNESIWYNIRSLFDDKYSSVIQKRNQALKQGKILDDTEDPVYALHELAYLEPELKNFIEDNMEPIFKKSKEILNGWSELGKILQHERAIYERGEMANPKGYDPKTAQDFLNSMEKSINPSDWKKLQEIKQDFRAFTQKVVDLAEKNGYYTPELIAQMKANPAYATFQVLDYIDTYISPHVYQQVGTLKDIANPANSTFMKDVSLFKAIQRNNIKKRVVSGLIKSFPEEITQSKTEFNGRVNVPVETREYGKGTVRVIEDGKLVGYDMDKSVADSLNGSNSDVIRTAAEIMNYFTLAPIYRKLFVQLNPGFQTFNVVRDFMRYWKNVPDYSLPDAITSFPRALIRYGQALPHLMKRTKGIDTELIREMERLHIISSTYNDMFSEKTPESLYMERLLQKYELSPQKRNLLQKAVYSLTSRIENIGDVIEKLPKVAGYIELKGKMPEKQLSEFIRTSVGSPDFWIKGQLTPISNPLLLFSNAIKEGIKSDFIIATKPSRSRTGFWWKTALGVLLPIVLTKMALQGIFGDKKKKEYEMMSEYDLTNYSNISLGADENGKVVQVRIPRDETGRFIGSILWKMLDVRSKEDLIKAFPDIMAFGAGQFPNVTPAISGTGALIDYMSGNNPYDSFRNRNVIPDTEFKAGYKYSFPIFLDWFLKQQGLNLVLPSVKYGETPYTALESLISKPVLSNILGRWIKTTDYGLTEREQKINKELQQGSAQKSLDERATVESAIKDIKANSSKRISFEAQALTKLLGKPPYDKDEKTAKNRIMKKIDIGLLEGTVSREMDALINAYTNDYKTELLKLYKKDLDSGTYNNLKAKAIKHKVISKELEKELKKLGL
jgi:hypothetical protein